MASLNSEAGDCVLCPVPKKTLPSSISTPGAFQTAAPDGANFLTLVISPFSVNCASFSTL